MHAFIESHRFETRGAAEHHAPHNVRVVAFAAPRDLDRRRHVDLLANLPASKTVSALDSVRMTLQDPVERRVDAVTGHSLNPGLRTRGVVCGADLMKMAPEIELALAVHTLDRIPASTRPKT